jgi:chromosome partitioning protein
MAQIICIIGNKGGTGKTTLSHMTAHGLALFGKYCVAVLTDTHRQTLSRHNRDYLPFDARSPENLDKVVARLRGVDHWYGVVDGGGNRPEMDARLAGLADLVLLPFRDSQEDMRTLLQDLERFPNAWALPSQWPTNAWQQESARRALDCLPAAVQARVLEPVYAQSATKLLLQDALPDQLPTPLNNSCRMIALQVMELARIPLPEDRWVAIPKQTARSAAQSDAPVSLTSEVPARAA